MSDRGGNAPAWLFSFVDLAFLLLIAMTQIADRSDAPDLGEIVVPRLHADADEALPSTAPQRWQVRVHPRDGADAHPFELVLGSDPTPTAPDDRLSAGELRGRLAGLRAGAQAKPLLAPHRDSRSEDMLEAVVALEDLWPGRRRVTVASLPGKR